MSGLPTFPAKFACAVPLRPTGNVRAIAKRRREIYQFYRRHLKPLEAEGLLRLPYTPEDCTSNYHLFYILVNDVAARDDLLAHLKSHGIHAVFHYVPLHWSPMGRSSAVWNATSR